MFCLLWHPLTRISVWMGNCERWMRMTHRGSFLLDIVEYFVWVQPTHSPIAYTYIPLYIYLTLILPLCDKGLSTWQRVIARDEMRNYGIFSHQNQPNTNHRSLASLLYTHKKSRGNKYINVNMLLKAFNMPFKRRLYVLVCLH